VISTGFPSLDRALVPAHAPIQGGYPQGSTTELVVDNWANGHAIAIAAMRETQALGGPVAFIDCPSVGGSMRKDGVLSFLEMHRHQTRVDPNRVHLEQPAAGEVLGAVERIARRGRHALVLVTALDEVELEPIARASAPVPAESAIFRAVRMAVYAASTHEVALLFLRAQNPTWDGDEPVAIAHESPARLRAFAWRAVGSWASQRIEIQGVRAHIVKNRGTRADVWCALP
jgi:hypothetical protein